MTETTFRVLVIEDEVVNAIFLQYLLEELGYVVIFAGGLDEGLNAADEAEFDFALLDINLGLDVESFPIAERLRSRGVPFAFITAYEPGVANDRFPGIPVLRKPVETGELRRLIDAALCR